MNRLRLYLRDPRHRRVLILGAAAAAVVVMLLLRRNAAGAPSTAAAPTDTGDVGPLVDPSTLTDGTPSALDGGGGAGGVSAVSPDDFANLQDAIANLGDELAGISDGSGGGDTAPTDPGTSPSAPSAKQGSAPGFWWNVGGKQTFVTVKNKGAFLAELRKHGVNVDAWAAAHPEAARSIGIKPPPKPPPRVPGHSSAASETGGAARRSPSSKVAHRTPDVDVPAVVRAYVPGTSRRPSAAAAVLTHIRPAATPRPLPVSKVVRRVTKKVVHR